MWWMFACSVGPAGLDTPLVLEGDGVIAEVTSGAGCQRDEVRVGLWGERFGTRGFTLADAVPEPDGATWLHFRVETGLGEAIAAMRIEGDGAVLPLGTRAGELEMHLSRVASGTVDRAELSTRTEVAVAEEKTLWENGAFVIRSGSEPVGEIQFRGDSPPIVSVADAWWLTPRPVEASMTAEGAELVITFDVEPSFQGEGAQLRVNVPVRTAVAPLGPVPVPEERRFSLEPGRLSESERIRIHTAARSEADALERRYVEDMGRRLAAAANRTDGRCSKWSELEADWGVMFPGYEVEVRSSPDGCAVGIEPARVQHGRRFRGVVGP
jgi:hypothetical protein